MPPPNASPVTSSRRTTTSCSRATCRSSATPPDAHPVAEPRHRAGRAAGRERLADVLPEGDQQVVELYPVPARELRAQRPLRALRGPGAYEAQAVRDAVHVRVDADAGKPEGEGDDQVRGLPPHARERQEGVQVRGDAAAKALEELAGHALHDARLGAVEADREDRSLDATAREAEHGGGRVGESEEARRGRPRRLVARTQREEARDQDTERVARRRVGDGGERGRVPGRLHGAETRDDAAHGRRVHGRADGAREPGGAHAQSRTATPWCQPASGRGRSAVTRSPASPRARRNSGSRTWCPTGAP